MTPERRAEAEKASSAFQTAMAFIGVATIEEAYSLWASLPPEAAPAAVDRWLRDMGVMAASRRAESRELAMAYYRLARALHTGRTVADPWNPSNDTITLGTLRSDFADLVDDALDAEAKSEKAKKAVEPGEDADELVESDESNDTELVEVDPMEGVTLVADRDDADAEDELRGGLLVDLASHRSKRERARSQADLTEADVTAANVAAAMSQKVALNGGRSTLHSVNRRDKRAIGYVRVSKTGTPCGFCAMLISRGVFLKDGSASGFYRSAASAGNGPSGDDYHPNCYCEPVPVFSQSQYESDPTFSLNREYSRLWPQVTGGHGGRDALNAWRRYIDGQRRAAEKNADTQAV